jgi:hypothetical protein
MKWKTIVNSGAERGFVVGKAALAIEIGQVVIWAMNATDDGLAITDPGAVTACLVAGTAHTAIASGSKGLVQCYGLDDDAVVARVGSASNDSIVVGDVYDIYSASSCLSFVGPGRAILQSNSNIAGPMPFFVAAAAVVSGGASSLSTSAAKVFIRCL